MSGEEEIAMRMTVVNALMVLMLLAAGAEKGVAQQQSAPPPSRFRMSTTAYADGNWIPAQYACGTPEGASPGVNWSDPPQGTASFALIFHDTDAAPQKGVMDVTHWILWNIAATAAQIPADIKPDTSPDGIVQGKNIRGVNGYQPPCPPVGARPHHYIFELYALDTKLDLPAGSSRADLLKAMDGHVLGKATFVGIFGRGIEPEKMPGSMTGMGKM
jgi:Raf kinase inhibitor-like YbhB/YbcL family protein